MVETKCVGCLRDCMKVNCYHGEFKGYCKKCRGVLKCYKSKFGVLPDWLGVGCFTRESMSARLKVQQRSYYLKNLNKRLLYMKEQYYNKVGLRS